MAGHSMSGPDPLMPDLSATAILRDAGEDVGFENDFAELAARFSAVSGGGLSAELSADLALEIVLNELVEQACRITGATGAAILLDREGEMVCRASSGPTSPELGSRIDAQSGIGGECLKTRRTQCCDDALSDPRANVEASEQLGVRSVIAMPLLQGQDLVGVFEVFSAEPFAFGVRDERALEVLADRTVENLLRASQKADADPQQGAVDVDLPEIPVLDQELVPKVAPQANATAAAESAEAAFAAANGASAEVRSEAPLRVVPRSIDTVVRSLAVAVTTAAILLGIALGWHVSSNRAEKKQRAAAKPISSPIQTIQHAANVASSNPKQVGSAQSSSPASEGTTAVRRKTSEVPPGGLMVFDNGKEVFSSLPMRPSANRENADRVQMASELTPDSESRISAADVEHEVIHRVSPEYPKAARDQRLEGQVVLDVHIGANGAVQGIAVASGAPLLAQASTRAVKQWKFKPSLVNGRPAEMQTTITLNFKLQ